VLLLPPLLLLLLLGADGEVDCCTLQLWIDKTSYSWLR
jgi:hypothetical protein